MLQVSPNWYEHGYIEEKIKKAHRKKATRLVVEITTGSDAAFGARADVGAPEH